MWKRLREVLVIGLSFLFGTVVSKLLEPIFNPSISFKMGWLDLFLLALFGTLGIMIWFIVGTRVDLDKTRDFIERVIERKIDQIGTSVEYIEEEWGDESPRTGRLFDEELKYTGKAEQELLVLANLSVALTASAEDNRRREVYLKAVEENIIKHKGTGFKYVRISQVAKGTAYPKFVPLTKEHFRRIFQIKSKYPTLELELMVVNTNRDFSFILIDGQTLILEVAALKSSLDGSQRYALGYFIIADHSGQLIRSFEKYFRKMERQARPVTLKDLD